MGEIEKKVPTGGGSFKPEHGFQLIRALNASFSVAFQSISKKNQAQWGAVHNFPDFPEDYSLGCCDQSLWNLFPVHCLRHKGFQPFVTSQTQTCANF